ncbi:MAG TPA: FAD binding domain-containing protein [Methylomirabilota bacterium]|jgi:carbon-monoxide dehydrogenase medium subunit|nr:FAD binding domain-containing protein [Methylomirabilota bacterium]
MLRPFALHRPSSLHEAGALLAALGGDAALYAGGTELLQLMKEGLLRVGALIDLKRVPGLGDVRIEDGGVVIGATARHRTVERSPVVIAACPIVARVAQHVANVRVRNVGTVGGNLAFADPHSDLATLFLALDATVRLWRGGAEREVPLAGFVRGAYETGRQEDEILTAVRIRPWPSGTVATYVKFGMYERPTVAVALALMLDAAGREVVDARITVGCVGPRPQRFPRAERLARGRAVSDVVADAASLAAAAAEEVEPADDLHGSAEYKREMARVFVGRALRVVGARATGQEHHAEYRHTVIV